MEPERPIEKLLRVFAKKRRDQAGHPLEMHPATRRLLQSEVARRASKEPEPSVFAQLLGWVRQRPAFGLSLVIVGVIGAFVIRGTLTGS